MQKEPIKVLGIDEAGRGSVIGPLVVAGVLISLDQVKKLQEIGVKDSKKLSPNRRVQLLEKIQQLAISTLVHSLSPDLIDRYCYKKALNILEQESMVFLIERLQPDIVYIDALGRNPQKFSNKIGCLIHRKIKVIAENHADVNYPVVSAASILAKVTRDKAVYDLHSQFENFGSGYPRDPKTIQFLHKICTSQNLPPIVRKSWSTVQRLLHGKQEHFFSGE